MSSGDGVWRKIMQGQGQEGQGVTSALLKLKLIFLKVPIFLVLLFRSIPQ